MNELEKIDHMPDKFLASSLDNLAANALKLFV